MKGKLNLLLIAAAVIVFQSCVLSANKNEKTSAEAGSGELYVCIPCGSSCDTVVKTSPGICQHCKMEFVKKSTIVHSNIMPADLYQQILKAGAENIILLDVRTSEEFNGTAPEKFGRLRNAINISIQELQARIKELDGYKDKQIIVYCSHSHRSPRASYMLTQYGFKNVANLQHGMHMWKEEVTDKSSNDNLYITQL